MHKPVPDVQEAQLQAPIRQHLTLWSESICKLGPVTDDPQTQLHQDPETHEKHLTDQRNSLFLLQLPKTFGDSQSGRLVLLFLAACRRIIWESWVDNCLSSGVHEERQDSRVNKRAGGINVNPRNPGNHPNNLFLKAAYTQILSLHPVQKAVW